MDEFEQALGVGDGQGVFLVFLMEVQMALGEREPYFYALWKGLYADITVQIAVHPLFLMW